MAGAVGMRRLARAALATALLAVAVPAVLVAAAQPAAAAACGASQQALPWTSCVQTAAGAGIVFERVGYQSGGRTVYGTMCRPYELGRHPIAVLAHPGFQPDPWTTWSCGWYAAHGYVALAPDYRTFVADPAAHVLCDGEVDDLLTMLAIGRLHPSADPTRVVLRGASHGGCVVLRAYQRGVPGLVAAAAISPLTNLVTEWAWLQQQLDPSNLSNLCGVPLLRPPICKAWQALAAVIEAATGGTPTTAPGAYLARSVDADLQGLRRGVPLLVAHGDLDQTVPEEIVCATVAAVQAPPWASDFAAYRYTPQGALTAAPPPGCPGFSWRTAPDPVATGYPQSRYLLTFDGLDHDGFGPAQYAQVDAFLLAKTPS
jgi:hypothetical protein